MKAAQCWKGLSEPKRFYLMAMALMSGPYEWSEIVDVGNLPASTNPEYEGVVEALRSLMRNDRQWREEEEEREAEAEERWKIDRGCAEKVAKISVPPPEVLGPMVLSEAQRGMVKNACAKELAAVEGTKRVAATIDDFASFCGLLARPENHMRIKGQYVDKQYNTRLEGDMVQEMARQLIDLPIYTTYAKVREEGGGEWKGRIRTIKLEVLPAGLFAERESQARVSVIEGNSLSYLKKREQIEEEMRGRGEHGGEGS